MKYKAGDTILGSTVDDSCNPNDHLIITVLSVGVDDYYIKYQFFHMPEKSTERTWDEEDIDTFANNYLTAMSPLGKALS